MKLNQLYEQHVNTVEVSTAFYGVYEDFSEKQGFLRCDLCCPSRLCATAVSLGVCSSSDSYAPSRVIFASCQHMDPVALPRHVSSGAAGLLLRQRAAPAHGTGTETHADPGLQRGGCFCSCCGFFLNIHQNLSRKTG